MRARSPTPTSLNKRLASRTAPSKKKNEKGSELMPIGFKLFSIMRKYFAPVDIISCVRHNKKLELGNWRKAAEEGNFFLRGFNYCFIMRKV